MKTFNEWLLEKDPTIEEGWGKNLITAGLLGAAGLGMINKSQNNASDSSTSSQKANISNIEGSHQNDLLQAAKRAGVPKSEWNKLRAEKVGGIIISVNGRKVPLSKSEMQQVRVVNQIRNRMNNM